MLGGLCRPGLGTLGSVLLLVALPGPGEAGRGGLGGPGWGWIWTDGPCLENMGVMCLGHQEATAQDVRGGDVGLAEELGREVRAGGPAVVVCGRKVLAASPGLIPLF